MIEKYTRNTRFCLICNYVSKIIPALQSRCTRFRFPPLAQEYVRERLQEVIDQEQCVAYNYFFIAHFWGGGTTYRRDDNASQFVSQQAARHAELPHFSSCMGIIVTSFIYMYIEALLGLAAQRGLQ